MKRGFEKLTASKGGSKEKSCGILVKCQNSAVFIDGEGLLAEEGELDIEELRDALSEPPFPELGEKKTLTPGTEDKSFLKLERVAKAAQLSVKEKAQKAIYTAQLSTV